MLELFVSAIVFVVGAVVGWHLNDEKELSVKIESTICPHCGVMDKYGEDPSEPYELIAPKGRMRKEGAQA